MIIGIGFAGIISVEQPLTGSLNLNIAATLVSTILGINGKLELRQNHVEMRLLQKDMPFHS